MYIGLYSRIGESIFFHQFHGILGSSHKKSAQTEPAEVINMSFGLISLPVATKKDIVGWERMANSGIWGFMSLSKFDLQFHEP